MKLPPRYDGLNEVDEEEQESLENYTTVQVSLYKNSEDKKGFIVDIKKVNGDLFAIRDFYHLMYKSLYG